MYCLYPISLISKSKKNKIFIIYYCLTRIIFVYLSKVSTTIGIFKSLVTVIRQDLAIDFETVIEQNFSRSLLKTISMCTINHFNCN